MESAATTRSSIPEIYWDLLELYRIRVHSVSRDRDFDTICVGAEDIIYRRKHGESHEEGQELLFSSPKQPFDLFDIAMGSFDLKWGHEFHRLVMPKNEIQSVIIRDPQYPDASVEVICEWIFKAVQAHIEVTYYDGGDEDSLISISHGEISAISGNNQDTKRLLLSVKDGEELRLFDVQRKKPIPLGRSVVASRLRSNFVVNVNLKVSTEAVGGGKRSVPITGQLTFTSPWPHHEVYDEHDKVVAPTTSQIIRESSPTSQKFMGCVKVKVRWYNDLTPYKAQDTQKWDKTETVYSDEEYFEWDYTEPVGSDEDEDYYESKLGNEKTTASL